MHVLGLAAFVLAIALAISRIGLVLHELVGHGVLAVAAGSRVTGWSLHAFGGGWIGYDRRLGETAAHAVQVGGLAVELVAAVLCALVTRRTNGLVRLGFAASACALAIHAGWYLAAGTYHGFGDGWLLHRELGAARFGIVVPVAIATVVGTYLAARRLAGAVRALVPVVEPRRQLAAATVAIALGLGGHAALLGAELALREDRTYTATMRTAGQRAADRELAIRVETAERAGRPLDVRAARRELERKHRQFPFAATLIGAMVAAAIAGIARSRPAPAPSPVPARAIAIAAIVALVSVALVVGLDIASP